MDGKVAKSIEEALPKLTDYSQKNWPQWKRIREHRFDRDAAYTMYTAHVKWSFYGAFTVKQREDGRWVADRCSDALLHDGEEATFATAELARRVADLHERDGFVNLPSLGDGYSWQD